MLVFWDVDGNTIVEGEDKENPVAESLCGSSPASSAPIDASTFSRTLVASTLSGDGLLKFAGFKATLTGDTNEDCQPFADTSTSDSSSIS